jgi:hypothetical protein
MAVLWLLGEPPLNGKVCGFGEERISPPGDLLSLLCDKESRQKKRTTHQPACGFTARRNSAPDAANGTSCA